MESFFTSFLVLASCLLSAVDFSRAQVPTCTYNGQFICASSTNFATCPVAIPAVGQPGTRCSVPFPNRAACYGVGPDANSVCYDAPCPIGIGNYPIPHATNAYYICSRNADGNIAYSSSEPCPTGYTYNAPSRVCVAPTITTPPTNTAAITTTPPVTTTPTVTTTPPVTTTFPPRCAGQKQVFDPTSCNHFYACGGAISGSGTRTRCPFRMRFDIGSSRCRVRFLTNCGTRPDTSG